MDKSQGTILSFGTNFIAEVIDFTTPRETRKMIETTHLTTVGAHTKTPGDLYDTTPMSGKMAYDPGVTPPITSAVGNVVITYPSGKVERFVGCLTGYGGVAVLVDDKMVVDFEITPTTGITHEEAS